MKYIALIGDIINSRKIENRSLVQEQLSITLEQINQKYQDLIAANFLVTIGDEFQGLLKKSDVLFEIIETIQFALAPYEIRFGIGVGEIITKIDPDRAISSDGPAWWYAREMIEELKNHHEWGTRSRTNIKLKGLHDSNVNNLINSSIYLLTNIRSKWTKSQKEIISYIIKNYGYSDSFLQTDLANHFGLNKSSINKTLKSSQFYDYVRTYNDIEKIINNDLEDKL